MSQVGGGCSIQALLGQVTLRTGPQLFAREAGDVGRLLQTLSVFVVTTVFVFLAAAAMAGIVAARAWNSAAHRGANINGFERCFRQQIENWAARFGDCLLRGAVAVIEHFLPILIRGFRIVFANNRLQSRIASA